MKRVVFSVISVMVAMVMMAVEQPTESEISRVKIHVVGHVVDNDTDEGEPYATVRLFKGNGDKAVASVLTDEDGNFDIEVRSRGHYTLVVSSVGRNDEKRTFDADKTDVNLGTLRLTDNAMVLEGVEVIAQKPIVKMETDRMTYNVEDDTDSHSNSVLEMLRKVPMVSVDGQDNITVKGSSNFQVYVDGKPSVMFSGNPSEVLKSLPASMVKKIEVITNPGAKYDAEGVGGVINLIFNEGAKQHVDSFTGTVKGAYGNQIMSGSVFVAGQKNKLSYSANVSYNRGSSDGVEVSSCTEQESELGTSVIESMVKTSAKLPFLMGSLSVGYDLDTLNAINTNVSVSQLSMNNTSTPRTMLHGGIYGDGFSYDSESKMKMRRTSLNWGTDYQHFFSSDRTSSFALTYQLGVNPQKTDNVNTFKAEGVSMIDLANRVSHNDESTLEHIIQADFTSQLAANHVLNYGAKGTLRHSTVDAMYEQAGVSAKDLDYRYNNNLGAAYLEYRGSFGKASLTAGLRYEHTWIDAKYSDGKGVDFNRDYGNLVPSATVSYQLGQQDNIGVNYAMRLSRPGITYLNPYVNRNDPTSISYGNPDLDVEKSHSTELVFNHYDAKFMMNATLSYSFCDNQIEQYSFYKDNLMNTTYGNVANSKRVGLSVYANWMLTWTTRLFINGGVSYNDMRSTALDTSNSGWQGNLMAGVQQSLPHDMNISAFLITSTRNYTLQGHASGFNILSANVSKSFLNKRLNVSVGALFGLSKGASIMMNSYSHSKDFTSYQNMKIPMRNVSVSVSYTFGSTSYKAKERAPRTNSDYMETKMKEERMMDMPSM